MWSNRESLIRRHDLGGVPGLGGLGWFGGVWRGGLGGCPEGVWEGVRRGSGRVSGRGSGRVSGRVSGGGLVGSVGGVWRGVWRGAWWVVGGGGVGGGAHCAHNMRAHVGGVGGDGDNTNTVSCTTFDQSVGDRKLLYN